MKQAIGNIVKLREDAPRILLWIVCTYYVGYRTKTEVHLESQFVNEVFFRMRHYWLLLFTAQLLYMCTYTHEIFADLKVICGLVNGDMTR